MLMQTKATRETRKEVQSLKVLVDLRETGAGIKQSEERRFGNRGSFELIGQTCGQGTRTSQSQTDTEEEGVFTCLCLDSGV